MSKLEIGTNVPANDRVCPNKNYRVISIQYFGYLVGQLREIIDAIMINEKQKKAFESIVLDRMYSWFDKIGDQLTPEEYEKASEIHWADIKAEELEQKNEELKNK